jgi:RHS repeat-associated protein
MFPSTKNTTPFWFTTNSNCEEKSSHPFGSYPKPQISDLVVLAAYPFGSILSSVSKGVYRYGMNGQEMVNEIAGFGNHYTAEHWEYDPRLGRRWNIDPVVYPWQSGYAVFNNNPVYFKDPLGAEGEEGNKEVQKHTIAKGENLTGIAKKYNTSVETLAKWNNISDVNKIYAGNELIVSDPTRPSKHSSFESYPEVQDATGWTTSKLGLKEMTVNNGVELAAASLGNFQIANLGGGLLEAVKNDPDMLAFQAQILSDVKSDPRYGKEAFYRNGVDVREFGGKRGSGDDWFSLGKNDPILKKETWQVAANQLTWALRHATVKYWAEVGKDGTITIQFRLYDTLDLSGQAGRSGAYNTISEILGFGYHTVAGGNKNLQTRGQWTITK